MIYGYARVSTDGQSVAAQVAALNAAGAGKVFREVASGARADRARLRKAIAVLQAGDVLMATRLDRLARSTRDLLNTLAAISGSKAGFRSLGDTWADTTTAHGRLMLTVLGGLAEFERDLIRDGTLWRGEVPAAIIVLLPFNVEPVTAAGFADCTRCAKSHTTAGLANAAVVKLRAGWMPDLRLLPPMSEAGHA